MSVQNELNTFKISVIIPTLNEEKNIEKLIQHLLKYRKENLLEIIVADGGSQDNTVAIAKKVGAKVTVCNHAGRAYQMNQGSSMAGGNIFYFVHCDTLPPTSYVTDILSAIQSGFPIGCFRSQFDSKRLLLKINGYFSRFDRLWCRGGDQTLFVTKDLFKKLNGYKEELMIMEEYDFLIRAAKYPFKIIPSEVLVSARKYENRSFFKVQFANLVVFNMFRQGASQQKLIATYEQLLGKN